MRKEIGVACPYCGEHIVILLDPEEAGQIYTEDCQVCCRPMRVECAQDGEDAWVGREDE